MQVEAASVREQVSAPSADELERDPARRDVDDGMVQPEECSLEALDHGGGLARAREHEPLVRPEPGPHSSPSSTAHVFGTVGSDSG